MAVIKIACTKCGQRVSGDESFYGTTVECPVCSSVIAFPEPITNSPPAQQTGPSTQSQPESQGELAGSTANDSPESGTSQAENSAMPKLGSHGGSSEMMQTTSIPLMPENIITQDANRIGALNAAMHAAPDEPPPSTLQSILSMVFGILGLVFFPFGAPILFSPAAIITGHIALAKSKHSRIPTRAGADDGPRRRYPGLLRPVRPPDPAGHLQHLVQAGTRPDR